MENSIASDSDGVAMWDGIMRNGRTDWISLLEKVRKQIGIGMCVDKNIISLCSKFLMNGHCTARSPIMKVIE